MDNYRRFKTVGELIDILKELPRDTKIVKYTTNMEKSGFEIGHYLFTDIEPYTIEKRNTYDAFDGTPYSYDCITKAKNGDEVKFNAICL